MTFSRRLCASIVAVVVVAFSGVGLTQPRGVPEGPGGGRHGPCVGITTATLRAQDPVITRVYRVYADGTVETYDDGAPGAKSTAMGK